MFLVDQLGGRKSLLITPVALILLIMSSIGRENLFQVLLVIYAVSYTLLLLIIEEFDRVDRDLSVPTLETKAISIFGDNVKKDDSGLRSLISGFQSLLGFKFSLIFSLLVIVALVSYGIMFRTFLALYHNIGNLALEPSLTFTAYLVMFFLSIEILLIPFKIIFVFMNILLKLK